MAQNIRLKRTSVSGRTGTDANLLAGELAMNTVDGLLWGKGDSVFEIITENRVYSQVTPSNKVVTEAELSNLVANYDLDQIATYTQNTLPPAENYISDGLTTDYVLASAPSTADAIDVYVNDVLQRPGEVFYITDDVLTFTYVPASGDDIYIKYRYPFATIVNLPDNSVTNSKLDLTYTSNQYTGDGANKDFTIQAGHTVHSVLVIVNGSILPPTSYVINGTTLTIINAPLAGAVVDFRYLPV